MNSYLVHEEPQPHKCVVYPPFPLEAKPVGSIARCDCGRYFVSRPDAYRDPAWKPLRWWHRRERRIINGDAS